ncbi:hypothetical protein [Fervidibacillus albus]|uniref:Uncharacterized protein n=1 Tax=Fervidibacillus albus TaxID=2980026 RepID=A0A9E8LU40_9BACI|nr:hypothetical protein [Fervidibacillus albus]WAA09685.1 hypothetical protein OE104_14390 [Fervidibacillus albus]
MQKVKEQTIQRDELIRMLIQIIGKTNERIVNLEVKVKNLEDEWKNRQSKTV